MGIVGAMKRSRNKRKPKKKKLLHLVHNCTLRKMGGGGAGTLKLNVNAIDPEIKHCSPLAKQHHVSHSCLTPEAIFSVRDAYNRKHPPSQKIDTTLSAYNASSLLRKRLGTACHKHQNDEDPDTTCWLNQISDDRVRRHFQDTLLVPKQPCKIKDPYCWLSNWDIAAVLKQYESAYPEFKLFGPTVLDYDAHLDDGKCVDEDVCHFNLKKEIQNHKTKLAFSFNLSKHDEPGTHWTTLFVNVDDALLYYYDSALNPVPKEIQKLVAEITRQGQESKVAFTFQKNKHQHQHTNTECGMYSLFFSIVMLTGELPDNTRLPSTQARVNLFGLQRIPDAIMKKLRSVYFSSS